MVHWFSVMKVSDLWPFWEKNIKAFFFSLMSVFLLIDIT